VGSAGGDDGIVGTDPEGGGELDEVRDGKSIAAALEVDGGSSNCIVALPDCLRCSTCTECPARIFPAAKLTRVREEKPASESKKRGREEKRVTRVTTASKSGRIMTVNPVRHPICRLRSWMTSMLVSATLVRVLLFGGGCERVGTGRRYRWGDGGEDGARDSIGGSVERQDLRGGEWGEGEGGGVNMNGFSRR